MEFPNSPMMTFRLFTILLFGFCAALHAEVSCPPIFGDHMVLQRERPITVWGQASPAEKVTVEFAGQTKSSSASENGEWRILLDPLKASAQPRILTVRGSNVLTFSDVLVGEVWLCSGQSNMEKPLGEKKGQKPTDNYEEAIRQADHPDVRLFQMPREGKPEAERVALCWVPCSPESIVGTRFSAAAYYLAVNCRAN